MFFGKAEREKENSFNVSSNLERTEVRNTAATARRSDFFFFFFFGKSLSKPDLDCNQRIMSIANPEWKSKKPSAGITLCSLKQMDIEVRVNIYTGTEIFSRV